MACLEILGGWLYSELQLLPDQDRLQFLLFQSEQHVLCIVFAQEADPRLVW